MEAGIIPPPPSPRAAGLHRGELLEAKNEESFDVVVTISQMVTKYELLNSILEIDVSDPQNITANINKIEITGLIPGTSYNFKVFATPVNNTTEEEGLSLNLYTSKELLVPLNSK